MVVTVARSIRTWSGSVLLAVSILSACGGATDRGRPQADVTVPETIDPCAAADGLMFQDITTFDRPYGAVASYEQTLCDKAVDNKITVDDKGVVHSGQGACTFYNFDSLFSPKACSTPTRSNATCLQADLTPTPESVCLTTNFPSMGAGVPATEIPGGRCGVPGHAFHLEGSNIATCYDGKSKKQGWGASLQITFNSNPMMSGMSLQPVDASAWDGISLWLRRGPKSNTTLLIAIQDVYSSPTSAADSCISADPPVGMKPFPDAVKCDGFASGVLLTSDWRFVRLPFTKVKQKGFGRPSPLGELDTAALTGLQFTLAAGDWDVWVDDIAFYKDPSLN